ncbi:MAG: response regulator [Magnetococcales bacterium]|nr:response regulator [Magnetococcales bacterium]
MDIKPDALPFAAQSAPFMPPDSLMEQITRLLDEGLFILDVAGRLTFLNAAGTRILGWEPEALLGEIAHLTICYPNTADPGTSQEECPVYRSIRDGRVYHVEEDLFVHRDGRLLPVSFTAAPLWDKGVIVGSVTVFKELSSRQELEREIKQAQDIALETARLKAEFLSNMSHEIRTPIHGIIGLNDLLLDSKLGKEQRELASATRDSAQALLTIVNDILDFSRIEAGKLEIRSEEFRPFKIVEEVAGLVTPQAQGKNINLSVDLSNRIPILLQGDPARVRQVLLILVGNAVKFTKKGTVAIRVRLEKKTKAQVTICFAVADTGIGIPKANQHRLFQPFAQVDGSSTRPYGGTGLGLSIASRLVELMGGQIGYENRKERGSLFWFSIPLARSSTTDTEPQSRLSSTCLPGVKVLIVDPQQTSQTVLLNALLQWNMKATSVESTAEIRAYLKQEAATGIPCRLVLISRPRLTNSAANSAHFSVVYSLAQDPELPPVQFILLTGSDDKKYLEDARQAGYVAILGKPVQRDRLLESLVTLLSTEADPTIPDHRPSHATGPGTTNPATHPLYPCHPPSERNVQLVSRAFPSPGEGTPATATGGGQRILLAEDNAVIQKAVQIQLHRLGYGVHTVANGQEAVSFMRRERCALVLMDCHMPVLDGYQATQAIRSLPDQPIRVPIIGMVAQTVQGEQEHCVEVGMDAVLSKPVQLESLKELLDRWLPEPKNISHSSTP